MSQSVHTTQKYFLNEDTSVLRTGSVDKGVLNKEATLYMY